MYSIKEVQDYCARYGKKQIIIDTNVLLVLLIGMCDANALPNFNCTKAYGAKDYQLLLNILRYFKSELLVTPHVIAEFSGFLRKDVKEPKISHFMHKIIEKLKTYQEEHAPLELLLDTDTKTLVHLGFPDISIIGAAKKMGAALLTADLDLGVYADKQKIPNVKFGALAAETKFA